MTLEMGKPLAESKTELAYGAEFFCWFSEEAVRIDGRYTVAPNGVGRLLTMRQPVGPCLLITPWNFPMAMGTRKIGPAVAAGCTIVIKPAEQTPLSMLALAEILAEAGLPKGVSNVITSTSPGAITEPLLSDPRLRKLSFTGSTPVGHKLIEQSARQILRVSMELGGNAPFLIFEDAVLEAAVEGALIAKMRNMGEACTAANRFHVAAPVAAAFAERLGERMGALKLGRGTEEGVQVGPLIDQPARQKVSQLVEDALDKGARVVAGGEPGHHRGYFYKPTGLADVPREAHMLHEEVFGPVAPVASFDQARLLARQGQGNVIADRVRVVDEALRDVPCDGTTMGEVVMHGNHVMKGYYENPGATASAFTGGWFHSGDIAVWHPDGYIELRDRKKDVIISGGENISTIEVEQTVVRHPAVLECAVVAIPDERWGERPKAFVTLKPGHTATEREIITFCREHLAHFKCPAAVEFGDLPKTSTGKIQKYVLREREWMGREKRIN